MTLSAEASTAQPQQSPKAGSERDDGRTREAYFHANLQKFRTYRHATVEAAKVYVHTPVRGHGYGEIRKCFAWRSTQGYGRAVALCELHFAAIAPLASVMSLVSMKEIRKNVAECKHQS